MTPATATRVAPTGTDSATSLVAQTNIIVAPPQSDTPIPTATTLPSNIPLVIQPPGGLPPPPDNSVLVAVAYSESLNWNFVSTHPMSATQIFGFTGPGVCYGIGRPASDCRMHSIEAGNTISSWGFIATVARVYINADLVASLDLAINTPSSLLYQNADPTINTLMSLIRPSWPLVGTPAYAPLDGGTGVGAPNPHAGGSRDPREAGAPLGSDSATSQTVSRKSVAVGSGAIGAALLYGGAMFMVAKRYRKRRRNHRRSNSSLATSRGGGAESAMQQSGGSGWAAGAAAPRPAMYTRDSQGSRQSLSSNGRTIRSAGISAPVMAENSLGWN